MNVVSDANVRQAERKENSYQVNISYNTLQKIISEISEKSDGVNVTEF